VFKQSFLAAIKKFGQEVMPSFHFYIAGDKPGEEKIPLVAAYLCTRTIISAFKVYSNLGEVIVCAYPVVSV
jgi:hypothetical protein